MRRSSLRQFSNYAKNTNPATFKKYQEIWKTQKHGENSLFHNSEGVSCSKNVHMQKDFVHMQFLTFLTLFSILHIHGMSDFAYTLTAKTVFQKKGMIDVGNSKKRKSKKPLHSNQQKNLRLASKTRRDRADNRKNGCSLHRNRGETPNLG